MDPRLRELENVTNNLEESDKSQNLHLATIDAINTAQANQIGDLEVADGVLQADIGDLENADTVFEQRVVNMESTLNVTIGFHAKTTPSEIPLGTIIYSEVLSNAGNRYSSTSGLFTADRPGLYHFTMYWSFWNGLVPVYLVKNGVNQCHSAAGVVSPTCSVVLELVPGDEVYVMTRLDQPSDLVVCPQCNGFSGFLITQYV